MPLSLTIHNERFLCTACKKVIGRVDWVGSGPWNDKAGWQWWHRACAPVDMFWAQGIAWRVPL